MVVVDVFDLFVVEEALARLVGFRWRSLFDNVGQVEAPVRVLRVVVQVFDVSFVGFTSSSSSAISVATGSDVLFMNYGTSTTTSVMCFDVPFSQRGRQQ